MNPPGTDEHSAEHGVITQWAVLIAKAAALGVVGVDADASPPPNGFRADSKIAQGITR